MQTAASVLQHISLGVAGLGCEDALMHLLNFVWPNVFEVSQCVGGGPSCLSGSSFAFIAS